MDALNIVVRVLHIIGALVLAGGMVFSYVLHPWASEVPEPVRARLWDGVRRRFGVLVMLAVGALLLSGLFNYLRNQMPLHKGHAVYHAVMGAKIILALVVFSVASLLVGKTPAFEGMRRRAGGWLALNVILVLIIVGLAAVLGAIPDAAPVGR